MDLLDALRPFTSLDLPRRRPEGVAAPGPGFPWEAVADLAVAQGLAPLLAYHVEYQLAGAGAPQEVRDALLGHYHATVTDNVYKLVQLRKLLAGAPEVPVVLLSGAAYVDALYPHGAFRPLPELRLAARRTDFQRLALAGAPLEFRPEPQPDGAVALTDGRTLVWLHDDLFGGPDPVAALGAVHGRGIPAKVFGPRVVRPALEDALLSQVALLSRAAFAAPLIQLVDLRELALGAPGQAGTWHGRPDREVLGARAVAAGLSRALFCALEILARLFPEAAEAARGLVPELPETVRAEVEAGVVQPGSRLRTGPEEPARADEVRRLVRD